MNDRTVVDDELAAVEAALADAEVSPAEIAEVRRLVGRAADEASIAVIGPHNAGKTTLIAVVTGDERAVADIGPVVQTHRSAAYTGKVGRTSITVWDTPGLGTEHLDHDAEARDRITKADAVVLAMTTEPLSDRGRDQLAELLKVGRKRGAVLPVVTKADREPVENRPAIERSVLETLPETGEDMTFVAAGEALDARLDGDEDPPDTGVPQFAERLLELATGEARRRITATAAVLLLTLIESGAETLASREPEHEVALRFQRRLRKVLIRADRRVLDAHDAISRKERLAAFRATAVIGQTLDEDPGSEQVEVAAHEAWDAFATETARLAEQLGARVTEEVEAAAVELERLEQGPLADALHGAAAALDATGAHALRDVSAPDQQTATTLLNAARRAATVLRGASIAVRGRSVPLGGLADAGIEALDWHLQTRQAEAVGALKDEIRAHYATQAERMIEKWHAGLDEFRDETTRPALHRTDAVEQQLFTQLQDVQLSLQRLAASRTRLDDFITAQISAGYLDSSGA